MSVKKLTTVSISIKRLLKSFSDMIFIGNLSIIVKLQSIYSNKVKLFFDFLPRKNSSHKLYLEFIFYIGLNWNQPKNLYILSYYLGYKRQLRLLG